MIYLKCCHFTTRRPVPVTIQQQVVLANYTHAGVRPRRECSYPFVLRTA